MAQKREKCVLMRIPCNFPNGTASVLLVKTRNVVERQVVKGINGPYQNSSDGFGNEDLGAKPGED